MTQILFLLIGVGVGYVIGKRAGENPNKEEGKRKIVQMLVEKNQVRNDDVERALGVSDATATRYLDELEREGAIEQVGREGRFVTYKKK